MERETEFEPATSSLGSLTSQSGRILAGAGIRGLVAETVNERITRLEYLMGVLAEKQARLDDVLVVLTEAQIKTEERFRETDQRFRDADARIEKLVVAIGEFLRNKPQ